MAVLVLTILVSLILVGCFVGLFLYLAADRHSDPERDCLLPFTEMEATEPPESTEGHLSP